MVTRPVGPVLLAAGLTWGGGAVAAAVPSCEGLLPASEVEAAPRALGAEDLVRLRDIGPVDPQPSGNGLLALSPDGSRVAFELHRADPDRNDYCVAMLVLNVRRGGAPIVVDETDTPLLVTYENRGKEEYPTGIPKVIAPRWSSDGRWIAFLKSTNGIAQVWRARADGGGSQQLSRSAVDVEDFRFGTDGATIVFSAKAGLAAAHAAIAREALGGWRYDDRFSPMNQPRPFAPGPVAAEAFALDIGSGAVRTATPAERRLLSGAEAPDDAVEAARSPAGRRAWLEADRAATLHLLAEEEAGNARLCPFAGCAGSLEHLSWQQDGRALLYFRREGWAQGSTAIYRWRPGGGPPRRLYLTDDVLADCAATGGALLCLREASLTPRRLEWLDPATGRRRLLFDPNPHFGRLTLGKVERLHLINGFGLQTLADLVLPVGYRPGQRYPTLVVQYDTRGFLRGGTGDEYPIQLFANAGYAVLSVRRPIDIGALKAANDEVAVARANLAGFADRRSALSSVDVGVRMLIAQGIADPARIGITGLSDGAGTATFALLHSSLFAAAAMSQCCFDTDQLARVGPAGARYFRTTGYPNISDEADSFWREISLAGNARRIAAPILLQISDDEYMSALRTYTALREVGAPIDMYVFPGEHHVKWQPAHRLAVYRRTLAWFDYWLRGLRSTAPERRADLDQWDALRAAAEASKSNLRNSSRPRQ